MNIRKPKDSCAALAASMGPLVLATMCSLTLGCTNAMAPVGDEPYVFAAADVAEFWSCGMREDVVTYRVVAGKPAEGNLVIRPSGEEGNVLEVTFSRLPGTVRKNEQDWGYGAASARELVADGSEAPAYAIGIFYRAKSGMAFFDWDGGRLHDAIDVGAVAAERDRNGRLRIDTRDPGTREYLAEHWRDLLDLDSGALLCVPGQLPTGQ